MPCLHGGHVGHLDAADAAAEVTNRPHGGFRAQGVKVCPRKPWVFYSKKKSDNDSGLCWCFGVRRIFRKLLRRRTLAFSFFKHHDVEGAEGELIVTATTVMYVLVAIAITVKIKMTTEVTTAITMIMVILIIASTVTMTIISMVSITISNCHRCGWSPRYLDH